MKNIPNILTLLRILMVPLFVYLFFLNRNYAILVFILANLTDALDGFIARYYDASTKFGMIFDPFADKLLQVSTLFCLVFSNDFPIWVFTVFLIKELLMVFGAIILLKFNHVVSSKTAGKVATVLMSVCTIAMLLFGRKLLGDFVTFAFGLLIVGSSIIALYSYSKTFFNVIRQVNK